MSVALYIYSVYPCFLCQHKYRSIYIDARKKYHNCKATDRSIKSMQGEDFPEKGVSLGDIF